MYIEVFIHNEIKAIKFKEVSIEFVMNKLKERMVLNIQVFVFDLSEAWLKFDCNGEFCSELVVLHVDF